MNLNLRNIQISLVNLLKMETLYSLFVHYYHFVLFFYYFGCNLNKFPKFWFICTWNHLFIHKIVNCELWIFSCKFLRLAFRSSWLKPFHCPQDEYRTKILFAYSVSMQSLPKGKISSNRLLFSNLIFRITENLERIIGFHVGWWCAYSLEIWIVSARRLPFHGNKEKPITEIELLFLSSLYWIRLYAECWIRNNLQTLFCH